MGVKRRGERLLVVDDAEATLEVLRRNLEARGYVVVTASSVAEAIGQLEASPFALVITDLKMPKVSGLELVRHVRENYKDLAVLTITGYPSVGSAVEAVRMGAEDYLTKPFTDEELAAAVLRALDTVSLRRAAAPAEPLPSEAPGGLVGQSPAMRQVFRSIARAAGTPATVLITGESGTGKELVARALHYGGRQAAAPFVPVNCGGIPESLLESELFGHVKGAFTGAVEARAGFFQTAEGGTIFLDEVSETSPAMQVKLLRVLQEKEVCMVGSAKPYRVAVRVVAASNKDLLALTSSGRFREDLFFRLNVLSIAVPPLRERGDDVLLLVRHFSAKAARELGRAAPRFTERALEAMRRYAWPGNVRELENFVQRAAVMAEGDVDVPDLPSHIRYSAPREAGVLRTLAEVELEHLRSVLAAVGGNRTRAAQVLGIDRKTLRLKLRAVADGAAPSDDDEAPGE